MRGRLRRRAFLYMLGALGPMAPRLLGSARGAGGDGGASGAGRRSLALPQNAASPVPITLDEFVAVSERLTGHRPLDHATARIYLDALLEPAADRALLVELAHSRRTGAELTPAHAALERRIVEYWYTGVHQVNGSSQVATYAGALMWNVLGGPAPGSCAGETGSWSRAPEAGA